MGFSVLPLLMAVIPKKRGRPATGKDPVVTVRLPAILVQQIDDWAEVHGVTRSDAIRGALEALVVLGGLDQDPEPPKPKPGPKVEASASAPMRMPRAAVGSLLDKKRKR